MATWTSPTTWIATDTPDHTDMNEISENLRFLHTKDKVHAYRAADNTVSNSTWEVMNWTAEEYDSNSMHNNSTNNGRLTAATDGAYLVEFKITWAASATGIRRAMIRKNSAASDSGGTGMGVWYRDGAGSGATTVDGGRLLVLSATDYVELFVYQTSGSGLDITSGTNISFFQMIQITG